jgi:glucans biosynthesis protein
MLRFLLLFLALTGAACRVAAFGFDDVSRLARDAAAVAWIEPADPRPPELRELTYDQQRDIRFRPEKAVWRDLGLPFELQFFHLGRGLAHPVEIHEVHDGHVRRLAYEPAAWDFGANRFERSGWGSLGHAGFRVHHALNSPAYKDELLVFLGASYFRALGRGQQYGLSARALAIDTVGGAPEEFPRFTRFWIERPAPGAKALSILALLESPRATGAVRFVITPGDTTTLDTRIRVYLRAGTPAPAMLGIAPLTSMFLHGENQPQAVDYRPEVHDSDGLQIAGVGPGAAPGSAVEWIWRPLVNPPRRPYTPLAPSFSLQRLHGFGLMQRDRSPRSYEDPEARYERRPSAWVEPLGDWGAGRVQLLMLPTPDETEDNIVAAWVPATLPRAGEALELAYRLHWQALEKTLPGASTGLAHTTQSRRGRSWAEPQAGEVQHLVDFEGPALAALPAGAAIEAVASTGAGARVLAAHAYPLPPALGGGWRLQLRVQRDDPTQPLELRAFLRHAGAPLTETWAALLPPEPTR